MVYLQRNDNCDWKEEFQAGLDIERTIYWNKMHEFYHFLILNIPQGTDRVSVRSESDIASSILYEKEIQKTYIKYPNHSEDLFSIHKTYLQYELHDSTQCEYTQDKFIDSHEFFCLSSLLYIICFTDSIVRCKRCSSSILNIYSSRYIVN